MAESALDRLACGLGGKTVLPHILSNVSTMLANPNWKYRYNYIIIIIMSKLYLVKLNSFLLYRHAALMAISAVGEGCHKQMQPMLQEILDGILNFLQDPVSNLITLVFFRNVFIILFCSIPEYAMQCVMLLVRWQLILLLRFKRNSMIKLCQLYYYYLMII